jgi:hypothetical protein
MKAIYIYALLLVAGIPAGRAQNIFSGGNSDGFSSTGMGFEIYAGGISNGFATDSNSTPVPLPVTLLTFTAAASGSQVQLQWQTAFEENNDHFEVLRSADARSFNWLFSVASHGDSRVRQDYQAMDAAPLPGTNYYRLKQVDKDGQAQLSNIVAVNMTRPATGPSVKLYPNPVSQVLYINITSTQDINSALVIYNAAGRQVMMKYILLAKGENALSLNVSALVPGIYFCLFEDSNTGILSFMKQ